MRIRRSIVVLVVFALVAGRPALATSSAPTAAEGVVATENPLAAAAGAGILAAGGSAVDAVIATALAVCTVHPSSCGIGGGGFLVVWDAKKATASALDFRECVRAAKRESLCDYDGWYITARIRRG
ncbi:MAG: gamma-glutamyltransferase, partial [bacterium]